MAKRRRQNAESEKQLTFLNFSSLDSELLSNFTPNQALHDKDTLSLKPEHASSYNADGGGR